MSSFSKKKAAHLRLGSRGERVACELLKSKHYDILCRNFKRKQGEIDIIARDGATICFVEVKTRSAHSRIRPAENLSKRQQKRISRAAMLYLKEIHHPRIVYRFYLIEVIFSGSWLQELRHWSSHFKKH